MAVTGQEITGPRPVGVSAIDHHGAALFAMGILAALVRRQRTGEGCRVDASLMQSALDLQAESLVAYLNAPQKPETIQAFRHVAGWHFAAPYGVYPTKDGHIALSLSPLKTIGEAIGQPRLASYSDRDSWTNQDEISGLIAERLRTDTTANWVSRMEPFKIWHAPVQSYREIVDDPQVKHMKSLVTVPGVGTKRAPVTLVNHPVLYDGRAAEVTLAPQQLGAQTEEVLREIGLGFAEIQSLASDRIVKLAQR
jgi:crotonobetainyl-CoA:carnitine CoA-transferase CaiB-like acyl-CoA transferase